MSPALSWESVPSHADLAGGERHRWAEARGRREVPVLHDGPGLGTWASLVSSKPRPDGPPPTAGSITVAVDLGQRAPRARAARRSGELGRCGRGVDRGVGIDQGLAGARRAG